MFVGILNLGKVLSRTKLSFNFEIVLKSIEPSEEPNFKNNPSSLMISHLFITKSRIF